MTRLIELNIDVLDLILSELHSTTALAALGKTCHFLHLASLPFLYAHISLERDAAQVLEFCATILSPSVSGTQLGNSILSLSIGADGFHVKESVVRDGKMVVMKSEEPVPDLFAEELAEAIALMPRLGSFSCCDFTDELLLAEPRIGSALFACRHLSEVRFNGLDDLTSPMIESLSNLRVIHFAPSWRSTLTAALGVPLTPMSGIGKVIANSRETLEEVSLPRCWLRDLIAPSSDGQQPTWPKVHTLHLPHAYANLALLGKAFPNIHHLSALQLRDDNSRDLLGFQDPSLYRSLRSIEGHFPMVRAICQGRALRRVVITSAGGARLQDDEASHDANQSALRDYLDTVRGTWTRSLKFNVLGDVPVRFFRELAESARNVIFLELMIGDNWKTEGQSLPKLFQIIPALSSLRLAYLSIQYHPFKSRLPPQQIVTTETHKHTLEALIERMKDTLPALNYIQISSWADHWGKTWWKIVEERTTSRRQIKRAVVIDEQEGQQIRDWYDWRG